jgi:bacterioferritin (cytochrome b1)
VPVTRDMLVTELQNLLRLTAFEQTIATVRRTQARTAELEKELTDNVQKARERSHLLVQAIREVGGVPDVVGSALGKAGAFATTQLNQVQTLQGALLGDLSLEHQLRERTRYARTLAESLNETRLLPVFDRLETAHTATIDWLEARLAEVGRTGTSMLRATPVQAVVTGVRSAAAAPLGVAAQGINRLSAFATKLAGRSPQPLQDALSSAVQAADGALDTGVHAARVATQRAEDRAAAAGTAVESLAAESRDAVSSAVQSLAARTGDAVGSAVETAETAVSTVSAETAEPAEPAETTVSELAEQARETAESVADVIDLSGTGQVAHPFAGYEKLSGDRIMGHIRDTEDVEELQQILAFEAANKARKGVLAAAQERLTGLSSSV